MHPFPPEPTLCELCLIREFLEVGFVLLRRVCCFLFFLDDLQSFDLLEGEAHDAAVLALVLEVDGLVVVVDEDLRRNPAAVVEPLCPLGDVFVLYPLGLLAHPCACSFPRQCFSTPKRLHIFHRREPEPLFTRVRGIGILRSSSIRSSQKFAFRRCLSGAAPYRRPCP